MRAVRAWRRWAAVRAAAMVVAVVAPASLTAPTAVPAAAGAATALAAATAVAGAVSTGLAATAAMVVATVGQARAHSAADHGETLPLVPLTVETAQGPRRFTVEVARTVGERSQGLMFRDRLDADRGMLFVFERDRPVTMWMKNTLIPLDMLFLDGDGRVIHIAPMTTPLSEKRISAPRPVRAVLELRGGVAALVGIKVGDRVVSEALAAP